MLHYSEYFFCYICFGPTKNRQLKIKNMKLKSFLFLMLAAPAVFFTACDKCTESGTIELASANQYLSITYLVDSNNVNYIDQVYNQANVSVLWNDEGGKTVFQPYSEDLSDGKFGPFTFSTDNNPVMGYYYHYRYIIKKDTFGTDTFDVKFYPAVDECHEFWGTLEYYQNGDLIDQCSGQEICEITIKE